MCYECSKLKLKVLLTGNSVAMEKWKVEKMVSAVGRASACCAGGRGFEPQTGPTLRVLK